MQINFRCANCRSDKLAHVKYGQTILFVQSIDGDNIIYDGTNVQSANPTGWGYARFECGDCKEILKDPSGLPIKELSHLMEHLDFISNPIKNIKISDSDWPEAVSPHLIANPDSNESKTLRAEGIVRILLPSLRGKKFLDFGTGSGEVVKIASYTAQLAVGYDIIADPSWQTSIHLTNDLNKVHELSSTGYDIILAFDVLDHVKDIDEVTEILKQMKSLLSTNGQIYLRCHPSCSRHGRHGYNVPSLNKAFAHYFIDDPKFIHTIKITNPLKTYPELFNQTGLHVISEDVSREKVEDYFQNKLDFYFEGDLSIGKPEYKIYRWGNKPDSTMARYAMPETSPVDPQAFPPNSCGLQYSAVWEWCSDWFAPYNFYDQIDPAGSAEGTNKTLRGGSFVDEIKWHRCASRGETHPSEKSGTIGFRVMSYDPNIVNNSLEMPFVKIKTGRFVMGSPLHEAGREGLGRDETQHRVLLTKDFYIGKYPVRQKEWIKIMHSNPSVYVDEELPVQNVSWYDAQDFCAKFSQIEGKQILLPTESQWEFCARGGNYDAITVDDITQITFIDYLLRN